MGKEWTASKWSNFGFEGSGWLGVDEGMGSKCVRAVERTGGEPKVVKQPLQLLGCWTLPVLAFNMPKRPKAEMGLGFGLTKV